MNLLLIAKTIPYSLLILLVSALIGAIFALGASTKKEGNAIIATFSVIGTVSGTFYCYQMLLNDLPL